MDTKEEFSKLVEENRFEEARILLDKFKYSALEDPYYYANMGWILNHMERYMEAEVILHQGIAAFPEDGWMYSQLGFCLDRQGEIEDGLQMLLTAIKLGFDEPWIHGEIGWCYKEKKEYKKAIDHFEDGLMEDEKNPFLLSQAAATYMELGDLQSAQDYYQKSYLNEPDNEAIFDLANFYRQVQNYEKEIELLNQVKEGEKNANVLFELGAANFELNKYSEALAYFQKSVSLGREDTGIRAKLGDTYLQLHQKKEADEQYNLALAYYEKALQHESDTYWIYQEMIWIAHKQCDTKKKYEYLVRASKEHEMTVWLMYHFARCYSDRKEYKKGADACKYCLEKGEPNKELYDLYAFNLGRAHKEKEAIKILEEGIQKYEGNDWDYGELGWNYAQIKEFEKALECFHKAEELAPDNAMHISMIAWCNLRLSHIEEAEKQVVKAMNLGRNDGWIHSVLAEIYENKKEISNAIIQYQFALDHDYDEPWIHQKIKALKKLNQG